MIILLTENLLISSVKIELISMLTNNKGFKKDSKNQLFLILKSVGTSKEAPCTFSNLKLD